MKIISCKHVNRSIIGAHLLGYYGKRILIHCQQECQIIVPQIFVKTVAGGDIQQPVDLRINLRDQLFLHIITGVKLLTDISQRI